MNIVNIMKYEKYTSKYIYIYIYIIDYFSKMYMNNMLLYIA